MRASVASSSSSSTCRLLQQVPRHLQSLPNRHVIVVCAHPDQSASQGAQDVVAVMEQQGGNAPPSPAPPPPQPSSSASSGSSSSSSEGASQESKYKVLLAIILKLIEQDQVQQQQQQQQQPPQQQQQQQHSWQRLEAFLRCQPAATSIPFVSWLADLEAATAAGASSKVQLAQLCEVLVVLREQQDREGQQALYQDTLNLLSGGSEQAVALLSTQPRQYALALAEGMTGQPLVLQGYGSAYDALLQVAPPAALTPEAVAQGHALAEELGADLTSRRKSTVAAMLGRVQLDSLSPEQQAALLGPSPAARILELLLSLPDSSDRLALLPDCFTPPEGAGGDADTAAATPAASERDPEAVEKGEETEELWCTPMQLLNEIDSRLSAAAAAAEAQQGSSSSSSSSGAALPPGSSSNINIGVGGQQEALPGPQAASAAADADANASGGTASGGLSGEALLAALRELRQHIQDQWLQSLPGGPS